MPNLKIIDRTETLNLEGLRINRPEYLMIHSTKTYQNFDVLLQYHKAVRNFNGVGYHIFIANQKNVFQARPFELEGAHAIGFNTSSIGVCFYNDNNKKKDEILLKDQIEGIKLYLPYKNLKIIPHTLGQVIYINRLFKEQGIDKQFPETIELVNERLFQEIKSECDTIVGKLSTSKHSQLKSSMKNLRNCPGEIFYQLIK